MRIFFGDLLQKKIVSFILYINKFSNVKHHNILYQVFKVNCIVDGESTETTTRNNKFGVNDDCELQLNVLHLIFEQLFFSLIRYHQTA